MKKHFLALISATFILPFASCSLFGLQKTSVLSSLSIDKGESYSIESSLLSCAVDNGYNYEQPDENADNNHFAYKYEFGKFVVDGVRENEQQYQIIDPDGAALFYRVTYDCDNLPLNEGDSMTSRAVADDSFSSGFYKMPGGAMGNYTVKKGLFVAYITYTDGTEPLRIIKSDIFKNKKAGEKVELLDGVTKECTIEMAICVEFVMWAPGILGISDDYWMNYRINQTIVFE